MNKDIFKKARCPLKATIVDILTRRTGMPISTIYSALNGTLKTDKADEINKLYNYFYNKLEQFCNNLVWQEIE